MTDETKGAIGIILLLLGLFSLGLVVGDYYGNLRATDGTGVKSRPDISRVRGVVGFALSARSAPRDDLQKLLDALRQVESNGDDKAVGDGDRSKGPYQCGKAAWKDACDYGGVKWDYKTLVWNCEYCEQVMKWYWQRYSCDTDEKKARCWNGGGPNGMNKKSTKGYWRKVQEAMKGN